MTIGFRSGGVDFDTLFALYTSGARPANSGIRAGGTDLSQRYQARGVTTKRADVGARTTGGVDVSNIWASSGAAGGSLSASNSGAMGSIFQNEPAPATRSVNASGSVYVTGGSGSYTCTWAHISGSTAIPTPGANNFSPSFTATVGKNSPLTAVKRCTVSDGVTSVSTDMNVSLEYVTDL